MKFLTTLSKNKDFHKIKYLFAHEVRKRSSLFILPQEEEEMGIEDKV